MDFRFFYIFDDYLCFDSSRLADSNGAYFISIKTRISYKNLLRLGLRFYSLAITF